MHSWMREQRQFAARSKILFRSRGTAPLVTSVLGSSSLDCKPYTQKLGTARKTGEGLRARQEERVSRSRDFRSVHVPQRGGGRGALCGSSIAPTSHTRGVAWHSLGTDLPRSAIARAPITEWIDKLRQLPQIRGPGCAEVPGVSQRNFRTAVGPSWAARHLQHSSGIKSGVRSVPLGT